MKEQIQTIFEKPMNRKQFFGHMGGAVLAAIGISGMIKSLPTSSSGSGSNSSQNVSDGYGSSAYGGSKKSSL